MRAALRPHPHRVPPECLPDAEPAAVLAPARGWPGPGGGRTRHIPAGVVYQGTTVQLCGLYPFVQGGGVPAIGVPIGRHLLSAEPVGLDPVAWLNAGLVTNPGVFLVGQPGTGKSTIAKRLNLGLIAFGVPSLVPGDPKGEYVAKTQRVGGQVIPVGHGLATLNPLDSGPLGAVARREGGQRGAALRAEIRARRMHLLCGLATLVRGRALSNGEEVLLGAAVGLLDAAGDVDPTLPDVVRLLEEGPAPLWAAAYAETAVDYRARTVELCWTLRGLLSTRLGGLFDGPSTVALDPRSPMVDVDLSRIPAGDDITVAAAMLSAWSWGFGMVEAAAYLGLGRRRNIVLDEMWRALRATPGLVEHADQLTRLNRATGASTIMITHSLEDLDALPTEADRAKARGFIERSAVTILAGLPNRELDRLHPITPLTSAERALVTGWAAPAGVGQHRRPADHTPPGPRQVPDQVRRPARHPGRPAADRAGGVALRHRPGDARGGTTVMRPAAPVDTAPWLILGSVGLVGGAGGLVWAGGAAASAFAGHRRPVLGFSFYAELARGRFGDLWPGTPVGLVWTCSAVLALLVGVPAVWAALRLAPAAGRRGLGGRRDVSALTLGRLRKRQATLRPATAGKQAAADLGVPLGRLDRSRTPVRASWEDVLLAVMAPRTGKTTALAVPAILDAPGAVVATSNKADLWAVTATRRSATGRVWTFDPQAIAYAGQEWWWDPLAEADTMEAADRLARHFTTVIRDEKSGSDFWAAAALDLLSALLLAAGGGRGTLHDVYRWLSDSTAREPVQLLETAGHPLAAGSLVGIQGGAAETREGIYQTARTAAQALRDPAISAWVTPADTGLPRFDPAAFAGSRDTLYLMSKDGAASAAPLVAALTDAVFRAGVRAAEAAAGRLDPPLLAVLDEAANICRIADLPDLYSHLGSRGIVPLTVLQSYRQGVRVWGEAGMDTLWSAATVKLIGPGIDDARIAEDLSRLVGEHEVVTTSYSRGRGGPSTSTSTRRERILDPGQIRALPRGTALLLATGARATMVWLTPWYAGPEADALRSDVAAAEAAMRARAAALLTGARS